MKNKQRGENKQRGKNKRKNTQENPIEDDSLAPKKPKRISHIRCCAINLLHEHAGIVLTPTCMYVVATDSCSRNPFVVLL